MRVLGSLVAAVLTSFVVLSAFNETVLADELSAELISVADGGSLSEKDFPVEIVFQGLESFELRSGLQDFVSGRPGLRGALETSLGRDAGWHAAMLDVKVADRQVWRELLKFTPVVTGTFQANRYSAADGSQPFDLKDREDYVAISASLPIWTSGVRVYGIKAAGSRRDSIAYDAKAVRDQATMKLIEYWTQAVSGARDREISLNAIKRLKRLRSAVVARQKAGFASSSDIAQMEADLAAAHQDLFSIEGALAKSRGQLLRLSGQQPGGTEKLTRFEQYMRDGRDAFIESAHRHNPQLQAAASRYRSEIYSTRSAMSRLLPSVNLTGEYRHYLDNPRRSSDGGLTIGVRLQVPLLDLSQVAETAAQSTRKEAALFREAATLNAVEMEIESLWSDRMTTIAMSKEVDREVAAREKSAAAARGRFEKGFGSLEEAIRADTALMTSQRTALQLAAKETVLAAQLLVVSGKFKMSMLD
ncbi:MAG: TolC family protein [Desulfomicrobium sp.]|uniref:TolC family protein n=1 Tax=Hoeflea sp. TaxID=1940281 RepID=UPI0025C218FF|nr:TolC family protein [Hoeflea sp.]MBU4532004.1 TolC family protein [Alphaproteobacteria bacterium]MBV1712053.1 TolC family protein [Desulfomicrobium sp.]MBV1782221.1 TolC family protein [Hoeflea sp.]